MAMRPVTTTAVGMERKGDRPRVVDRMAVMGLETFAVDLTRRTFALPVVRIVAPVLQLEPSEIVGERLAATRVETGGGEAHTCRVALF